MENVNLRGFSTHGVLFTKQIGNQANADCPFCKKHNKFYANVENKMWDCKACGLSGNFYKFLKHVWEQYEIKIQRQQVLELAEFRKLPSEAFRNIDLGWTGKRYAFPILDEAGKIIDIRLYTLGEKVQSTAGSKLGIFNLPQALKAGSTVYFCEGEWDAIALQWALQYAGVVGIPGANVFKAEWAALFAKRQINVCYDNDSSGLQGELKVQNALQGIAKGLAYLHWPDDFEDKYDINKLVSAAELDKPSKIPVGVDTFLAKNLKSSPRSRPNSGQDTSQAALPKQTLPKISTNELMEEYKKWLHMPTLDVLKIMYGVIIANKIGLDPIWLFLVAPPGGSKSELLMSLSDYEGAHCLTAMTPHTLISGAHWGGGKDPSLLPQLNNKILIIKDFTTILTMHYSVRDEIFGTLRDVYDGSTEKVFGNGVKRSYNVRFGVLAGVTPVIETFNIIHSSLGERFLKFRLTGNWDQKSEEEKIRRVLSNIGKEDKMREYLKLAATSYLSNLNLEKKELPLLTKDTQEAVVGLARFAARLRGVVEREKYSQMVMYKPSSEVGTRLAKQLAQLGLGIAIFLGKKEVDDECYRLVRRVALDTVPDRSEDIVRAVWDLGQKFPNKIGFATAEIVKETRLPQATVYRMLEDMLLLRIVEKHTENGMGMWKISEYIRELILQGNVYRSQKPKGVVVVRRKV